ncbi:helix-turn-helix transcriptional regulator [Ruminococcus gauvreauii]|uniref:Helix-turn-helix domain-containing protein n=1 Tax=Ruminococcus gauvreauii TaxID=438033 RepID=A0ABY5VJ34_9FIRM|nr:helix-turn-helix transcriptional regulator [Ruminococcus gauvreauii]UWP60594.1 helix-turn-helix domain-containing protein [Ruminococcus gauvreauii]
MQPELLQHNLKTLRKAHGYTQADMGRKLNIQRQSYANYENGNRIPSIDMLSKIAAIFKVTVDYLLHDITAAAGGTADPDFYSITDLITDYLSLPESSQKEIRQFIAFKKAMPD